MCIGFVTQENILHRNAEETSAVVILRSTFYHSMVNLRSFVSNTPFGSYVTVVRLQK